MRAFREARNWRDPLQGMKHKAIPLPVRFEVSVQGATARDFELARLLGQKQRSLKSLSVSKNRLCEKFDGVNTLHPTSLCYHQGALRDSGSFFGFVSPANSSPHYSRPDSSLGRVVGRHNSFVVERNVNTPCWHLRRARANLRTLAVSLAECFSDKRSFRSLMSMESLISSDWVMPPPLNLNKFQRVSSLLGESIC